MSGTPDLADQDYVADQYQTATNLNARISLHQRFSTNRYGWFPWLFDRLRFPPQARILELGCGPGRSLAREPGPHPSRLGAHADGSIGGDGDAGAAEPRRRPAPLPL